jgi:hypothetical protein
MLKLGSKSKPIGTPAVCPACRYPNVGINIWCERCRTPLDWNRSSPGRTSVPPTTSPVNPAAARKPAGVPVGRTPKLTLPKLTVPAVAWPRLRTPTLSLVRPRVPRVPRIALVVAAILAVLLIVPLAYVLLPAGRAAVERRSAANQLALTNGATAGQTAQAAAIQGVEAKTHLPYQTGTCATNAPCLTVASETMGKDAAAVVFSTASSAGRQCVGYVYRSDGRWHFRAAVCGLPGKLSPLIGHDATVHLPANCANVREGSSLKAHVVACLNAGTIVHVDGGPTYADTIIWWHEPQGWIAEDFLTGP